MIAPHAPEGCALCGKTIEPGDDVWQDVTLRGRRDAALGQLEPVVAPLFRHAACVAARTAGTKLRITSPDGWGVTSCVKVISPDGGETCLDDVIENLTLTWDGLGPVTVTATFTTVEVDAVAYAASPKGD